MKTNKPLYIKNREEWREWLAEHYGSEKEVWLVYFKKHTGTESIPYEDAVEEAICFGWIDGQVKKIDDERYMQRYSPRTRKSRWSESNIERAEKMIEQGRMTQPGLRVYREGTRDRETIPSSKNFSVPPYFEQALRKNQKALTNFENFSASTRLAFVYWVDSAKRQETRQRRIKKAIQLLAENKKLGED
jgi:uncharacterized protein YdeI (YjbR/CyaY-like superfamily)